MLKGHKPNCQCYACKPQVPWNKGLTDCYSEDTLKKMSESHKGNHYPKISQAKKGKINPKLSLTLKRLYKQGKIVHHNLGKTKETSESIRRGALKHSKTSKRLYAEGKIKPWQKGLTKQTSDSLRKAREAHNEETCQCGVCKAVRGELWKDKNMLKKL